MAELITIPTYTDERGSLSVLQDILPKGIERVFYIKGNPGQKRGGKVHLQAYQLLVCVNGSCNVEVMNSEITTTFLLNTSDRGLLLAPGDWHQMFEFSAESVLLVVSTEKYNPSEFLTDKPQGL